MSYVFLLPTLMMVFLSWSCNTETKDRRAEIDKKIGYSETSTYKFSAHEGRLHVRETSDTRLILRAGAPHFNGSIENTSKDSLSLSLTISNISIDTELIDNQSNTLVSEESSGLSKSWNLTIEPGATLEFTQPEKSKSSFNFLAMGDIQNGIEDFDKVIDKVNKEKGMDFLLFLGDLTMRAGKDEFDLVKEALDKIDIPVYSTPGNHDVGSEFHYHDYFGRGSYSWTHKGVRFSSLDSGSWSLASQSWQWYLDWLKKGSDQVHIVFSHIAPTESFGLRGGHWKSRREANAFIAHSSRGAVDTMLFGHLHTLDIFTLAGIPTYISGGAGAFEEYLDGISRHFLSINVDPELEEVKVSVVKVDK